MAIFNSVDRLRMWRYVVKEVSFISEKETFSIPPERVISLNIEENYEENLLPLFDITISLEASRYYKIIKNKNEGKLHVRLDRYYQLQNSKEKSCYYPFINDNFIIIMDKDNDDMLNTMKQKEAKYNYQSQIKNDVNNLEYTEASILHVYLFKPLIVDDTKTNINAILMNANVVDGIGYVMYKAKLSNLLMAKPDNISIIEQMFIPPVSALKAIQFLDSFYGIYKSGSIIYFGFDRIYILPYNGRCSAYEEQEIQNVTIIVPSAIANEDGHTSTTGDLYKKESTQFHYIVANYRTFDHKNNSISNNYLSGNNIKTVDSVSGKISKIDSAAISHGQNFTRIQVIKSENPYAGTIYAARSNSLSDIFNVGMGSINISDIAPNKRYNFVFEDSQMNAKYKGNYIISYAYHEFVRDGDDFSANTHTIFKKDIV